MLKLIGIRELPSNDQIEIDRAPTNDVLRDLVILSC